AVIVTRFAPGSRLTGVVQGFVPNASPECPRFVDQNTIPPDAKPVTVTGVVLVVESAGGEEILRNGGLPCWISKSKSPCPSVAAKRVPALSGSYARPNTLSDERPAFCGVQPLRFGGIDKPPPAFSPAKIWLGAPSLMASALTGCDGWGSLLTVVHPLLSPTRLINTFPGAVPAYKAGSGCPRGS